MTSLTFVLSLLEKEFYRLCHKKKCMFDCRLKYEFDDFSGDLSTKLFFCTHEFSDVKPLNKI